jgi:membrane protein
MLQLEIQDQDIQKILNFFGIRNPKVVKFIAGVEEFFNRADKHHIFLLSGGIAFNLLLYLIPLLLVAVYIVNIVFGVDSITSFLRESIGSYMPPGAFAEDTLNEAIHEVYSILAKSALAGWIGIITLLWLSSLLLSSIRTGLNTIFSIATPKIFIFYKIKDIFSIIVMTLLILISSYILPLISIIPTYLDNNFPNYGTHFSQIYFIIFSLVNSIILFYLLFRFIPNDKMPRFVRYLSISLCVVLVEVSRHIFSWYISGVSAYGKFYGTYAILASIALWIYYLTLIILASAEFSNLIYDIYYNKDIGDDEDYDD